MMDRVKKNLEILMKMCLRKGYWLESKIQALPDDEKIKDENGYLYELQNKEMYVPWLIGFVADFGEELLESKDFAYNKKKIAKEADAAYDRFYKGIIDRFCYGKDDEEETE